MPVALRRHIALFRNSKSLILNEWVSIDVVIGILERHNVDVEHFRDVYASGVFDYFVDIVEKDEVAVGSCPVMLKLLDYLQDYNIYVHELFSICTNFKKSMLNFTYDNDFNSKEVFNELSTLFDDNFAGLLKEYTHTIYLAQKEVEKASQAKEYFLSNMSHEIRTPLNAILGFVKILKDEENSKTNQKYLDIIENSSESLMHIINDILDFSKLRSGEFSIDNKPFNIHEELAYTLELFVANVNEKSQTLQSFIDPSIPFELEVDGLRVKQILSNFLSNAIKFTPKYGDIKVRVECKELHLIVSVEDNGIGISKKNQENIFNAFAQVDSHENIYQGTGLGLAICLQLAHLMGGDVYVDSEQGKGSIFTLNIPVKINQRREKIAYDVTLFQNLNIGLLHSSANVESKVSFLRDYWRSFNLNIIDVDKIDEDLYDLLFFVDSEVNETTKEILKHERTPSIALLNYLDNSYDEIEHITPIYFPVYCSKLYDGFLEALHLSPKTDTNIVKKPKQLHFDAHILVAEDNDANQELIKVVLDKFGISYYIASDGIEALQTFRITNFDLILMDEQMPFQSGSETLKKILAYEERNKLKHTPVIALTANVEEGVKQRSLDIGYDAFLTKPLQIKELTKVFTTYLQKKDVKVMPMKVEEYGEIFGVDEEKLQIELQLDEAELLYLIKTFLKKSDVLVKELSMAIDKKEYQKIEKLSHSLKGSSANFRLSEIEKLSSLMESSAREQREIPYKEYINKIEAILSTIYVK